MGDAAYLEKTGFREIMKDCVSALVESKPRDPEQILIDRLTLKDPSGAIQDTQGLSRHGKNRDDLWDPISMLLRWHSAHMHRDQGRALPACLPRHCAVPRYREQKLLRAFEQHGWTGSGHAEGEAVRKLLLATGMTEREFSEDVKVAETFSSAALLRVLGDAVWKKTNAEFEQTIAELLKVE